jgi:glycosyltransferase involved in cell wall biosynthesis
MSKVFIGLPTYNGEKHLREALDSIRSQSYSGWKLLISDNCSTDSTAAICAEYVALDERIQYHRQSRNIGAWGNFKHLLDSADCPYFAWFPDDYLMDERFLEVCVGMLDGDDGLGTAMTNIAYIDDAGKDVLLNSEAFKIVQHGDRGKRLVYSYLLSKEMAVLFYSVFRLDVIRRAVEPYRNLPNFTLALDCYIVLRALAQAGLGIERGYRQAIRYDERWYMRSSTFDYVSFGSGFGFYFFSQTLRALPWRLRPGGLMILTMRFMLSSIYKVNYVFFLYGLKGVFAKTANVFVKFRTKSAAEVIDERIKD